MVAGKNIFFTIIYTPYLIICASLKEIRLIVNEELMPQDLITEINNGPITLVKMVAGKNIFFTIIYTSYLIICASLKEIRVIV
jgi:hypothetical protein